MKQAILQAIFSVMGLCSFAQENGPSEITPAVLKKLTAEIETRVPAFKQDLRTQGFTKEEIEFSADTFRIEQLVAKRMDIDYSTFGMNATIEEKTNSYDKLMNKYYNKLSKALKPEDQKTLVNAQRAWIAYRDAERKLIAMMTWETYSGGGTIQSNITVISYSELVVKRTLEIYAYYDNMVKEQ